MDTISDKVLSVVDSPTIINALDNVQDTLTAMIIDINDAIQQAPDVESDQKTNSVKKPNLKTPTEELFSVYNVQLGESKEQVEQEVGEPKRQSTNEFGTEWFSYHEDYQNFVMISYNEENRVNGLFTNQDLLSSSIGITLESSIETVHAELGDPLTTIRKGLIRYQIQGEGEYDLFKLEDSYVTVFYDKHANSTVTAIQIIHEDLEENRSNFFNNPSTALKEGFEYQLFDLTNAARVNHGLNALTWDELVKETARKHSLDMAENLFFDHVNSEGQSPFDRMEQDGIHYTVAGENLAYGQFSSIFAH